MNTNMNQRPTNLILTTTTDYNSVFSGKDKLSPIPNTIPGNHISHFLMSPNDKDDDAIFRNPVICFSAERGLKNLPRNRCPSDETATSLSSFLDEKKDINNPRKYTKHDDQSQNQRKRDFGTLCKQRKVLIPMGICLALLLLATLLVIYRSRFTTDTDKVKNNTDSFDYARKDRKEGIKLSPMNLELGPNALSKREIPQRKTSRKPPIKNPENHSFTAIKVSSIKDFYQFNYESNANAKGITVEKLIDKEESNLVEMDQMNAYKISNPERIKYVMVDGPITEKWLEIILIKFDQVNSLTINIDELCIGATVPDRNSLPSIILKNLKRLRLESSHYCSIISWIFRWDLPNLEHLQIHNADLTKRTFQPIHNFLDRNKRAMKSVVISECFLCEECTFTEEENKHIDRIEILARLKNPDMFK